MIFFQHVTIENALEEISVLGSSKPAQATDILLTIS